MEATALLLNWKRPQNLKRIIEALRRQTAAVEIFVWNNSPDKVKVDVDWVVDSSHNIMCGARWFMAAYASSPYVFSLDDDLMPADEAVVTDCIGLMQGVDMLGYQGVDLRGSKSYMRGRHVRSCDEDAYVDVVKGRFLFTTTAVARVALCKICANPTLSEPSVEDDIAVSSVADRKLVPMLLRRRFQELPAPFSLCGRPDHYARRQEALEQYFHE